MFLAIGGEYSVNREKNTRCLRRSRRADTFNRVGQKVRFQVAYRVKTTGIQHDSNGFLGLIDTDYCGAIFAPLF